MTVPINMLCLNFSIQFNFSSYAQAERFRFFTSWYKIHIETIDRLGGIFDICIPVHSIFSSFLNLPEIREDKI